MIISFSFSGFFELLNKLLKGTYYIILLLITILIVYSAMKKFNLNSILCIILLYVLFIIILNTIGNNILSISVSNTVYPVPPNLGLDGISKNNLIAGINL